VTVQDFATQAELVRAVVRLRKKHGDYTRFANKIGISVRRLMQLKKRAKRGWMVKINTATEKGFREFLKSHKEG